MKSKSIWNYRENVARAEAIPREDKTQELNHLLGSYYSLRESWFNVTDVVHRIKDEVDFILDNKE